MHNYQRNEITPTAPAISTIYTARQNNELPSYTEIFVDDLPAYHQVVNENEENSRH